MISSSKSSKATHLVCEDNNERKGMDGILSKISPTKKVVHTGEKTRMGRASLNTLQKRGCLASNHFFVSLMCELLELRYLLSVAFVMYYITNATAI